MLSSKKKQKCNDKKLAVIYSVASYKYKHCGGDIRNKNKTL
jgi:hypothetical protein